MTGVIAQRMTAEIEDGVVLFLIGVRFNRLWKIWSWLPVFLAMPRMLRELAAQPELGLLETRGHFGFRNQMIVQYWRSESLLHAYAHARDRAHVPAWTAFNRAVGQSGDVGIWHETYVVEPGRMESVYVGMPPHGLGRAGTLHEATGRRASARGRLGGAASIPPPTTVT